MSTFIYLDICEFKSFL